MHDPSPLLVILEGLFYLDPSGALLIRTPEGGLASFDETLQEGLEVSLSLSYNSALGFQVGLPGFGCCAHPDSCSLHKSDPSYLYSFSGEGVITRAPQGNYLIGDSPLGVRNMPGHYGKLVLLRKSPVVGNPWENLAGEATEMLELLKALQREMP
jgi:hypothetical protein